MTDVRTAGFAAGDDGAAPGIDALRDLRDRRRTRRLGRLEWFDIAYKAYVVILFGGGVLLWVVSRLGDAPVVDGLADVARRGPAVVSTLAACAVMIGLRSGARGGPLAVEAADVAHVLLAPVPRRLVLRRPVVQRLRTAVLGGAGAGAVVGRLAAQRLPGSSWSWTAAGAAAGVLVGALWLAAALLAHCRPRPAMTVLGGVLVGWQAVTVVRSVPAPLDGVGRLAVAAWPDTPAVGAPGGVVSGAVVAVVTVALVAAGLLSLDRMSLEALARRSALVAQLRFAATMQDLRTVVLLRRQLDEEHPRRSPWVQRPSRTGRQSLTAAVWQRDLRGLARLPLSRLARMTLVACAWGVSLAATVRGTTPAVAIAGLAGFVLGLEALEPLSQEIDHADRCDTLPVERGELLLRHLAAPAVLLVPFSLVAAVAAILSSGDPGAAVLPAAVLAVPITWAAATGSAVSIVRDAPDPVASTRGTTAIAMPEVTGLGSVLRAALPLVVSSLGAATVLFVRAASRRGDTLWPSACRAAIGALLLVFLAAQWVRLRDRSVRSATTFLAEGRAARRPTAAGGA
ncbi:MAG: DUF6297 family protein [Ilumatobacteraceae bacterium]